MIGYIGKKVKIIDNFGGLAGIPELKDNVSRETEQSEENLLNIRFLNGEYRNFTTLDAIRAQL